MGETILQLKKAVSTGGVVFTSGTDFDQDEKAEEDKEDTLTAGNFNLKDFLESRSEQIRTMRVGSAGEKPKKWGEIAARLSEEASRAGAFQVRIGLNAVYSFCRLRGIAPTKNWDKKKRQKECSALGCPHARFCGESGCPAVHALTEDTQTKVLADDAIALIPVFLLSFDETEIDW